MSGSTEPNLALKAIGISRVEDHDQCLALYFNRRPTDQEMRMIQDLASMVGHSMRQDNPAHEVQ